MMDHDLQQVTEGFKTADETDMIGSKIASSPKEFIPYKLSSSIENIRHIPDKCMYFSY